MNDSSQPIEIGDQTSVMVSKQPQGPEIEPMLALVERATRDQTVDVDKMEKLLAMAERLQAKRAESEYDAAMNAAQSEMQPVARDSDNPQTRSRYASYGALDRAVRPIYTAHGFSLSFGTRATGPDRVTVTCRVSHRAGHTERVEIEMPADGKGAKGGDVQTKTHATGSAVSYGMRYLLKMIFNVSVGEYDDDGNAAGGRKHAQAPAQPKPQPKRTPAAKQEAPPNALNAFLARCRAKLVETAIADHKNSPYWKAYAIQQGWILPNESLEAIRDNPCPVFILDPNADMDAHRKAISDQFIAHAKAVQELADHGPEVVSDDAEPSRCSFAPGGPSHLNHACPNCGHTAVVMSKEYDGVLLCQTCAWQWDVQTSDYYEEHEWQKVVCPIPPPGMTKKDYDRQPSTLGQIARLEPKRFYGLVMNNSEAKARKGRDFKGKHYDPSMADIEFGRACDKARFHMEQAKNKNTDTGEDNDPDFNP